MKMKKEEKCPVCGSDKFAHIDIIGSEPTSVCVHRAGSVDVICCTNCGVLRVTQESLNFRHLKEMKEE